MLYQDNNNPQVVGIADYYVDSFVSVLETLRTMKMSNLISNLISSKLYHSFIGEVISREGRHVCKWPGNREELRQVYLCSQRSPRNI